MKLTRKSDKQADVDITDYYAVKPGPIWRGLKLENAAFWWLCIHFFFEYVRPQQVYPVIDILPYGYITLLIACVTALFDTNVKWVANSGNKFLMLFSSVILLSSVLAFHPSTSFDKLSLFVNWVVLYFLIITVVNTEKRFLIFLMLFLLVNFKMSQFGFRHFLSLGFGYQAWGVSGSPGWFKNAGDLGIEMAIFTPLSIAFALAFKDYWGCYKKLLFYMVPITGLVTIIATSARGAQLGILAAVLWLLLKHRNFKVILAIMLAGWLVYMILPEQMLEEYQDAGEDNTSRTRLAFWHYGMDVARSNPVLGVGYGNWMDYCHFINPVGPDIPRCIVAHNSYVTVVAETGYIGLVVYILVALFILVENAFTRANARQLDNKFFLFTAHALDAGLISYLVSSIFYSVSWYPFLWVQFAMTVALHEISKKQIGNPTESLYKPRQPPPV